MDDTAEMSALQQRVIERLRAGAVLGASDKEVSWRLRAEGTAFVFESFDQLAPGAPPTERVVIGTEAALIEWVRPRPESEGAWAALVERLGGAAPRGPALDSAALDGLVVFGQGPELESWVAFAEGTEERWYAGALRRHARVRIELSERPGRGDVGPFCWALRVPDTGPGEVDAEAWVRAEVAARLEDRLALAAWLDLSEPEPLEGGVWSARHADRYETPGMGFVVTFVGHDGARVEVPVDLARPGTRDLARERTAARTRLKKALRRALY